MDLTSKPLVSSTIATVWLISQLIAVVEDISKRGSADERQLILMRELAHTGMNLVAVVQSIAGRTMSGDHSLAEGKSVFIGRLQALTRTLIWLHARIEHLTCGAVGHH